MASEALQRRGTLTLEGWQRLPYLLPRAVVLEWTGLSGRELSDQVRSGRLRVFRGRRKAKYYRDEVGRLLGFPVQPQDTESTTP